MLKNLETHHFPKTITRNNVSFFLSEYPSQEQILTTACLPAAHRAPAPKKAEPKPIATAPKPAAEKKPDKTFKSSDGTILISVHEPDDGEDVADDPEWEGEEAGGAVATVSGQRKVPKAERMKKAKERKAKILTKQRPYKLEPFVSARIKEIRKLEKMMDEMSDSIRKKSGRKKKKKKTPGLGLW